MTDLIKRESSSIYIAEVQGRAAKHFERHRIRSRDDRSWLVMQPYRDTNEWESNFWFEVIALKGAKLLLHGDIDHVLFAYGDRDSSPERLLRWMGSHNDLAYYVTQKAAIGMGGRGGADLCLESLDERVWLDAALGHIEDANPGLDAPLDPNHLDFEALGVEDWLREMIEEVVDRTSIEEVVQKAKYHSSEAYEAGVFDWGKVPSQRLIYAHEALKSLVRLLNAEQETAKSEVTSVGG